MDDSEEYLGWHFIAIEEYSQFLQRCNWYTFDFVWCGFEHDKSMGSVELTLIALGLGFRISYNYAQTPLVDKILKAREEIEKKYGPRDKGL